MLVNFFLYICYILINKEIEMKKENKLKLMEFIYKIDIIGVHNAMLRLEFEKANKKEWRKFIQSLIDSLKELKE